jgi:hypothetical protein
VDFIENLVISGVWMVTVTRAGFHDYSPVQCRGKKLPPTSTNGAQANGLTESSM